MPAEYYKLIANYVTQDRDVLTALAAACVFVMGYAIASHAPRWRNQIVYGYVAMMIALYLYVSILIAGV